MYHFKDSKPVDTVHRIKGIISDLGVEVHEQHNTALDGRVHSLMLFISGTSISVNGKGINRELAMASAYGEFMERLQNYMLYPVFPNEISTLGLEEYEGFVACPVEKHMSIEQVWDQLPEQVRSEVFRIELEYTPDNLGISNLLQLQAVPDKLTCAPFFRMKTGELTFLPLTHLSMIYGTNGMCAGNSSEEALVQGLSEIMERYVNLRVASEKISLPTIPDESLRTQFHKQYEDIRHIEKTGKYKVIVKDCSLEKNLPVVAAILIDKEKGKYFVKFGAHPQIQIALERVITEMFQNRQLENFAQLSELKIKSAMGRNKQGANLNSIISNGFGNYPSDIFSEASGEYYLPEHFRAKYESNSKCLEYLVGLIDSNDWDLYIQDNTFLGFPCYRVIIPSVSEVYTISRINYERLGKHKRMSTLMKRIPSLGVSDLSDVSSYLEDSLLAGKSTTLAEVGAPYTMDSFMWRNIDNSALHAIVSYKLGRFEKAYESMSSYVSALPNRPSRAVKYYSCARDYIGLMVESDDIERNLGILRALYEEELVNEIFLDFKKKETILDSVGEIPCPSCSKCGFSRECYYEPVQNIHKMLKISQKMNYPDQMQISRIKELSHGI